MTVAARWRVFALQRFVALERFRARTRSSVQALKLPRDHNAFYPPRLPRLHALGRVEASPERPELQPQLSSRLKLGSFKVVQVAARALRRGPQQNGFSAFKPSPHPPARERALSSASTPSLRLESVQASTGAQRVQDSPSPLACAWTRSSARASPGGEPPLTTVNVRSQEAAAVLAL